MKARPFIATFIGVHVIFIFLQIHKHSQIIKHSYALQKNEQTKQLLVKKKQALTHQLYAGKNRSAIKDIAIAQLHMKPIQLRQIKTIESLNNLNNSNATIKEQTHDSRV